jgi:hypothetical protein
MHSRLEAAKQATGKHHAKTYSSFDPNAERESPPGLLAVRPGKRRRQAKPIGSGDQHQLHEQRSF